MSALRIHRITGRAAFAAILMLGLLAMTARPATDPDLWWHLRTGEWIIENGHVPHVDAFSFSRAGHTWVSHEWLSEVLFYELWKHAGAAGLIIFSAIITTAGFMLLYLRCPGKRYWAAAATVFGALAAAPCWGVRPQMFTFTLASLLLWLLKSGEDRPRLLLWIPPLFLLWINLHAGFALGPALLLAYGVGLLVEVAVGSTPWQQNRTVILRVGLLLLACLALIPVNPNGVQLYRYPFDTLRSPGMRSFIVEWFSPDFHVWLYRPFLLAWLLLITALAAFRSRPKARVVVPLLLTSFAALDAVRHIPIFVLLAMPVIAAASEHVSIAPSRRRRLPALSRPAFAGSIVLLMAFFTVVKWTILSRNQAAQEAALFPESAVSFLQTANDPRNVFVYYDWGGYVIWKLYPRYRVFADGRADLYGEELLRQSIEVVHLTDGWRNVLDRWGIESVLIPPSCALAQALAIDPDWRTEFADSKAVILIRTHRSEKKLAYAGEPSLHMGRR